MFDLKTITGLAAAALFASALGAQALVVTNVADAPTSWGLVDTTATVATPTGGTWLDSPSIRVGNSSGIYRSVFDNENVPGNPDNSALIGLEYFAVGPGNPTNPAVLDFAGVLQTSLSLLWGSPDDYNGLSFYKGGSLVATISSLDLTPPTGVDARGASFVYITDVEFDQLQFASSSNAFEFSNVLTTPIPLPAAAWLVLAGIGGLGLVSRRRKAA